MTSFRNLMILLISVHVTGCAQQPGKTTTIPPCIQQKIDILKKSARQNPPAAVYEYTYNDQKVYYFNSPCCDQYSYLYDSNCNVICAPDGGFTGKGDGKCKDFNEKKKDEKLIWKDER